MQTYITKAGDTWDAIARDYYENELLADKIMEANQKHLMTYQFDSGIELNIPELEEDESDGLPPWRD